MFTQIHIHKAVTKPKPIKRFLTIIGFLTKIQKISHLKLHSIR